jgi:chitin disaccharide deacetylase
MLIINADDWGGWPEATDAALGCYRKGRITSVSAMVFMEDSRRAAQLAYDSTLDVGLHLNFNQEFSDHARVGAQLAESHRAVVRFLRSSKYALLFYHPLLRKQFRYVFESQLDEFKRLYGKPPSHYDGHQHMHLCNNVLADHLLPEQARVRRSFSFWPGQKGVLNRVYRCLVDRRLAARHRLTDYFFSLSQQRQWGYFDRVLSLAQTATVELMVHPEWPEENNFLMGGEFKKVLEQLQAKAAVTC